ncbi:hypothetical protein D3C76_1238760 [compost metagenome]
MILLENGIQIAAVGVNGKIQRAWQIAKTPVWPDKTHGSPGYRTANQRVDHTQQSDFKSFTQQIEAQQHQQGDKHGGMRILNITKGKE